MNIVLVIINFLATIILSIFLLYTALIVAVVLYRVFFRFKTNLICTVKQFKYYLTDEYNRISSCKYYNPETHKDFNLKCSVNPSISCVQCKEWKPK
jgi:ABC-type transport system involved in cytochrome bd biosynthesis fused ATPase/permease subunit